jgi:RNA polymerase sigma factor (sigma-70 family)
VPNDDRSDAALLAADARGDAAAFGVLVRRHIRTATLLAAQLLGDRDDAEDIVQAAFTIVHDRARTFDPARPFAPWLYAIVRRLAANRRARDARRARLMRAWGRGAAAESAALGPERGVLARMEVETVRRAMAALSPMQRACLELVALHDLAPEEVAAMHGIEESTVRQHVFRARRALRRALDDAGVAERGSDEP